VHARPLSCWIHTGIGSHKLSCWIHKDRIVTKEKVQAFMTAARALGGKDECQVRLRYQAGMWHGQRDR